MGGKQLVPWLGLLAAGLLAALAPAAARAAAVLVVNSNGDQPSGPGICTTPTGACTLRAALQLGATTIEFALPPGQTTITPHSALPTAQDTTIDGTTQPGFVGLPIVEL